MSAEFQEVGTNTFILTFGTHADKLREWDGHPWLFDNHLFNLQVFYGMSQPNQWSFGTEVFWVQIYNLPMSFMMRDYGVQIGNSLGRVMELEVPEDGLGWGPCLQVRIEILLHKDIVRGRILKVKGNTFWASFKYEKLPQMCIQCGWILHGKSGCEGGVGGRKTEMEMATQFGAWLRDDNAPRRKYSNYGLGRMGGEVNKFWKSRAGNEVGGKQMEEGEGGVGEGGGEGKQ